MRGVSSTMVQKKINLAIAGVGNCASALVQGISFYSQSPATPAVGVMEYLIGGYQPGDIEIVAAFDVDKRKVGKRLDEAIWANPNCAERFCDNILYGDVEVLKAPTMDGYSSHMEQFSESEAFRLSQLPSVDVAAELRRCGADVLVCFLPVGSKEAVAYFANAAIDAKVGFVNCVPVFIGSDRAWQKKFKAAGLPLIGDDIKSQFGATIVHRSLVDLLSKRGVQLDRTYQLNTGGNSDFLNMLNRQRLESKKKSKTNAVQSLLIQPLSPENIHIGPSDYVPWQKDNKTAFIRIEGTAFGGAKIELDIKLSVQDSPNSAGVVIDAVRCAKLARDKNISGVLVAPSAAYMKAPPIQMDDNKAFKKLQSYFRK